jgi:hypothetical protein
MTSDVRKGRALTDTTVNVVERRVSAIRSLKEIITFLAGITFTIGITKLLVESEPLQLRNPKTFGWQEILDFLLLLVGLVRFYHGNVRFLDEEYIIAPNRGGLNSTLRMKQIPFDFVIMLVIALLFAALGFFIQIPKYFLSIYVLIIFIDFVWLFITYRIISGSDTGIAIKTKGTGLNWLHNNGVHVLLFVLAWFVCGYWLGNYEALFVVMTVLLFSNALFDFIRTSRLYFPPVEINESALQNPGPQTGIE